MEVLQSADAHARAGEGGRGALPRRAVRLRVEYLRPGERPLRACQRVMADGHGGGPLLDGIAFNVDTALWPDNGVREVQLAYKLDINEFRGNRSLQIIIDNIWPI